MKKKTSTPSLTSYRWVILALFILIALISQLLWLSFAPISSEMVNLYDITAFDVSLLSLVWPLIFVVFAIPVGIYIDKNGFQKSVIIGALFLAIFSMIRILSTSFNYNFLILIIAQSGAAISQPFIFGSITKLSLSWFPEHEQGLATGLATIGLFLGMMLALLISPQLFLLFGLHGLLTIYALIAGIGTLLFIIFSKEGTMVQSIGSEASFSLSDLWTLSKFKNFLILEIGFFAVIGGFTAILTWLEEILHTLHNLTIDQAGIAGGLLIIGGILGSVIIPTISDKTKKIKPFVLMNLAIGTISLYTLGFISTFLLVSIICFIIGFFLMSALPLVLEICSRITGPGLEGRASSLLWFFSQVGSVILIIAFEPVRDLFGSYLYALYLIGILWIISLILFTKIDNRQITLNNY